MFGVLRKRRVRQQLAATEDCAGQAGDLYDCGYNCAQAVLQATTGRSDPELLAMAEAFGAGIGASGCLCGAVTGGVMALGLSGRADCSAELVTAFRREFGTTCCRGLSKNYRWLSREHKANCRHLTVTAATLVAQLLES